MHLGVGMIGAARQHNQRSSLTACCVVQLFRLVAKLAQVMLLLAPRGFYGRAHFPSGQVHLMADVTDKRAGVVEIDKGSVHDDLACGKFGQIFSHNLRISAGNRA